MITIINKSTPPTQPAHPSIHLGFRFRLTIESRLLPLYPLPFHPFSLCYAAPQSMIKLYTSWLLELNTNKHHWVTENNTTLRSCCCCNKKECWLATTSSREPRYLCSLWHHHHQGTTTTEQPLKLDTNDEDDDAHPAQPYPSAAVHMEWSEAVP